MGRGSEFLELGIAQAQINAAKHRMSGANGLEAQHRYMRSYLAELLLGTLFGMLLLASAYFLFFDRSLLAYTAWPLAVSAFGYIAMKVRQRAKIRKKRAEDLRQLAIEKDKTDSDTEAKNA
jgi:hypothetical protein